jgi:alpha-tubulin suppressor-like RCC1 family protein
LALEKSGALWAWGQNDRGQVGDGTTNYCPTPTLIGTNTNWTAIAAGAFASLGLQSDGSLWQWGYVHSGHSSGPDVNLTEPTRVDDGTNWVAMWANEYCFVARQRDKSLWVWGPNAEAYFASTNRQIPVRFSTGTNWLTAALGGSHMLAVAPAGTLWSCGGVSHAAIGRRFGSTAATLQRVGDRREWMQVWAGSSTSFGLTPDGTLWTWGTKLYEPSRFSVILEEISQEIRRRGIRVPTMQRRQSSTPTPWPLVQFITNAVASPP